MLIHMIVRDTGIVVIRLSDLYEALGLNWSASIVSATIEKYGYEEDIDYNQCHNPEDLVLPINVAREIAFGWFYKSEQCKKVYKWIAYIDKHWNTQDDIILRRIRHNQYTKVLNELWEIHVEGWERYRIKYRSILDDAFQKIVEQANMYAGIAEDNS